MGIVGRIGLALDERWRRREAILLDRRKWTEVRVKEAAVFDIPPCSQRNGSNGLLKSKARLVPASTQAEMAAASRLRVSDSSSSRITDLSMYCQKVLAVVIRERSRITRVPWLPPMPLSNLDSVELGRLLPVLRAALWDLLGPSPARRRASSVGRYCKRRASRKFSHLSQKGKQIWSRFKCLSRGKESGSGWRGRGCTIHSLQVPGSGRPENPTSMSCNEQLSRRR